MGVVLSLADTATAFTFRALPSSKYFSSSMIDRGTFVFSIRRWFLSQTLIPAVDGGDHLQVADTVFALWLCNPTSSTHPCPWHVHIGCLIRHDRTHKGLTSSNFIAHSLM
ncbi:hypothetical protein M3J09_007242 [Ascochyta lentis]